MELEIMAFVVSVPIPILIPMPRFQCRGLQMATIKLLTIQSKFINTLAKDWFMLHKKLNQHFATYHFFKQLSHVKWKVCLGFKLFKHF